MLARVGRLDGDPLTRLHGADHVEQFIVVAILPDAVLQEPRHLVIFAAVARADEPGSTGRRAVFLVVHACSLLVILADIAVSLFEQLVIRMQLVFEESLS
ncbi:hypothetical protein D3C80_2023320 [compost metagenome]